MENKNVVEGVGKDAPIVTNSKGGMQSKSLYAAHLLDPEFLAIVFANDNIFVHVALSMRFNSKNELLAAIEAFGQKIGLTNEEIILEISKVLKEGAERYKPNNWRLIPQEEHLNHALIHYLAYLKGDTQDNHLGHFLCRLMFAYATEKSENFDYAKYVEVKDEKDKTN